MGIVLSIFAIAVLLVLVAVSLVRQRRLGAERKTDRDRVRAAPGLAADERLRVRRERIATGELPPG